MNELGKRLERMEEKLDEFKNEQKAQRGTMNALALGLMSNKRPLKGSSVEGMSYKLSVNYLCSFELMCKSTVHIICKFLMTALQQSEHSLSNPYEILDYFMFAPAAKNRKQSRSTEFGMVFRKMSTALAFSYLSNCISKAEQTDFEKLAEVALKNATAKDKNRDQCLLQRPVWTEEGFIQKHHMLDAIDLVNPVNETNKQNEAYTVINEDEIEFERSDKRRKINDRGQTLEDHIRKEVCAEIWKNGTDFLNLSRHDARRYFTRTLGFLFLDEFGVNWEFDLPSDYYNRVNDIPLAHTYTGSNADQIRLANLKNDKIYHDILAMFPKLTVKCEYTVNIYPSDKARNSRRGTCKSVRVERSICILGIAREFVKFYARVDTPHHFLRYVSESFQTMYMVAMAIAAMLHRASKMLQTNGAAAAILEEVYPADIMNENVEGRLEKVRKHLIDITPRQYKELVGNCEALPSSSRRTDGTVDEHGILDPSIVHANLM